MPIGRKSHLDALLDTNFETNAHDSQRYINDSNAYYEFIPQVYQSIGTPALTKLISAINVDVMTRSYLKDGVANYLYLVDKEIAKFNKTISLYVNEHMQFNPECNRSNLVTQIKSALMNSFNIIKSVLKGK